MKKITVLGDGGWGTALALTALSNSNQTTLWGPFKENLDLIEMNRTNPFLKGVIIPVGMRVNADMEQAVSGAEVVILASPSQFMRGTLEKFKPFFDRDRHILVNVAKGIENDSLKCMRELCVEILGGPLKYVALSGPSHAEEVSRMVPTAVTAASEHPEYALEVQKAFMNKVFRVYTTDDVVGVELGGAIKNVLAVAAGILDGMGLGDNTKAAMMTRGIAEMARLGVALGGKSVTFSGLSGIGDLIVTCMSRHSRNRFVGEELGKGKKWPEISKEMGMSVAEGVKTSIAAWQLARKHQVEAPIIDAVYQIIYHGLEPSVAVENLMTRDPKAE